jgi:hypothetical protein
VVGRRGPTKDGACGSGGVIASIGRPSVLLSALTSSQLSGRAPVVYILVYSCSPNARSAHALQLGACVHT